MNDVLSNIIDTKCPQFNTDITEGKAKELLELAPDYLDSIFRSSIKSLSPSIDLVYEGYRRLSPEEEFKTLIANDPNKIVYDLSISDIYAIEYIFKYQGVTVRRPLLLPFADIGNLIRISNTTYSIVPVLSDTVISPSGIEVFVRLLKDKLTFRGLHRNFILNEEKVAGQIIHTTIVKTGKLSLKDELGKPKTAVSLYLLGKYGLKETVRRYCKDYDIRIMNLDDITEETKKKFNIYRSTKVRPRNLKTNNANYYGHNVCVIVDKKKEVSTLVENFIFGILYTFDILPDNAEEVIELIEGNNIEDEILFWRILLGRISYRNSFSIDRIVEDMTEHFDTLEGYLDTLIRQKLHENNILVENFYDLLVVILSNFNVWLINSKEYNSNLNNRYIDILYYVMYDIIVGFNKIILALNKRASKNAIPALKEFSKVCSTELPTKKIFGLVKSTAMNLALALTEITTDIKYPKGTALLEDQSRGSGVRRGKNNQFPEATKTLKGHDLCLGSLLFLNKAAPSPRFRSNLYMKYDIMSGRIKLSEQDNKMIEELDVLLRGRFENSEMELPEDEVDISD